MAKESDTAHVCMASDFIKQKRDIIPCTLSFDIGLGGGVPFGCTVLIGGRPKSGKTSISIQIGANAQKMYGSKIFYFNIEGRLGGLVLQQIQGVDLDNLVVVNPPAVMSKDGQLLGYKKWYAEQWWDEIGKCIIENKRAIIIVDSIANLCSEKEYSETMGYQDRGWRNKLESQFCRKYGDLVTPSQNVLFLITHIQANTSGWGAPFQAKVGNDIKHQSDIILFCKQTKKWPESNGKVLGHDIVFNVECSALGPPVEDLTVPLCYGKGIFVQKDIADNALNWNIIQKAGSWFQLPFKTEDDKLVYSEESTELKLQGEANIHNWLMMHPKECQLLEQKIKEKIFG